jgi:quercetin dioxygenase-like cupin family protein
VRIAISLSALFFASFCAISASAQTPGPNPGVKPVRQMDRAEVRVTRVELAPFAVRSVHTHDDVRFHLFIPITGKIELTIGSAKPVEATPGQAYFMERGTPHGFRNLGSEPAAVMEVFVKDDTKTAQLVPREHADRAGSAKLTPAAIIVPTTITK